MQPTLEHSKFPVQPISPQNGSDADDDGWIVPVAGNMLVSTVGALEAAGAPGGAVVMRVMGKLGVRDTKFGSPNGLPEMPAKIIA